MDTCTAYPSRSADSPELVQCASTCFTGYTDHFYYACNATTNDIINIETTSFTYNDVPTLNASNTNSFCVDSGYPLGGTASAAHCTATATGWCPCSSWILGSGLICLLDVAFILFQYLFYKVNGYDPLFRFCTSVEKLDEKSRLWLCEPRNCWVGWLDVCYIFLALYLQIVYLYGYGSYNSLYAQCEGEYHVFGHYGVVGVSAYPGFAFFILAKECLKISIALGMDARKNHSANTFTAVGYLLRVDLMWLYLLTIGYQFVTFSYSVLLVYPMVKSFYNIHVAKPSVIATNNSDSKDIQEPLLPAV